MSIQTDGSIPSEIRWRLSSPNRFTSGPIGPDAFDWLVTRGWASDGSSASLDDIMGVRIGASGNRYEDAVLPANRHDCFYELGRLFRLSPPFRAAADADYRDRCIEAVNLHLVGWRQHAGVARAHARYRTLRAFGGCAWKAEPAAKLENPHRGSTLDDFLAAEGVAVAEVFHPGSFLEEELTARGWSPEYLARQLGWTSGSVIELLTGARPVSGEASLALAQVFGTDVELWLKLQAQYDYETLLRRRNQDVDESGDERNHPHHGNQNRDPDCTE